MQRGFGGLSAQKLKEMSIHQLTKSSVSNPFPVKWSWLWILKVHKALHKKIKLLLLGNQYSMHNAKFQEKATMRKVKKALPLEL